MKPFIIIAALIFVGGCSPNIRVYSDQDPDYEVKNFGTFMWGEVIDIEKGKNPLHYNELNDKRIKSAVLKELSGRGYAHSETNPDLIIHYHIIVDDQSVVTTEPFGYIYGPYWTRTRTNVYSYREGTLVIDLMDPKTNSLVWRGWATAALDTITAANTEEIINRAVARIFRKFPQSVKSVDAVASKQNR